MTMPLFTLHGFLDAAGVLWRVGSLEEANPLLAERHYLGSIKAGGAELVVVGGREGEPVSAVQVWRTPTARNLPADGSWLELSRWCLTADAGQYAGSRQHRYAVRLIRELLPKVSTLVSYSDPSHGHTGALYRACNWQWRPTWHRLRTPPTGNGSWSEGVIQSPKDRWVFGARPDRRREQLLQVDDLGAIRHWLQNATERELRWARSHPQLAAMAADHLGQPMVQMPQTHRAALDAVQWPDLAPLEVVA